MMAEPEKRTVRLIATMTRRQRTAAAVGFVLVFGSMGALLPLIAKPQEPRHVTLVVHRMAFYLGADRTSPNPTIRVAPGERIRVTLVSKDAGFEHDFAVTPWRVRTSTVRGNDQISLIFQAPDKPGTADYICTMHTAMMRGTIEVADTVQEAASSGY